MDFHIRYYYYFAFVRSVRSGGASESNELDVSMFPRVFLQRVCEMTGKRLENGTRS